MYVATIDSGTTHSRVYVVDEMGRVQGKSWIKAGVRDTAITGSRDTLKAGIKSCFDEALKEAGVDLDAIDVVLAAGMITSEIGLIDIPHLSAPVGISDLAENIERVHDADVFPIDVPVHFIRGIKNAFNAETITPEDVGFLDFMRGEEIQVVGLLDTGEPKPPLIAGVLSSHTKFIPVDADSMVIGSVTTLSGQIYEAVKAQTFVGKSTRPDDDADEYRFDDYWDESVIANAHRWVQETGISRTFLMTRFLDVLLHRPWYERRLFVEAAIAAEDLNAFRQVDSMVRGKNIRNLILVGSSRRTRIYQTLIETLNTEFTVRSITNSDEIDDLSIRGMLSVAKKAGLISKGEE